MVKSNGLLNETWIKSALLGTTWASSEIILGSFLHNLRIPFSGNILTAIGLIILISASYKWTEKGLFWRAGLICALLKTMSPSAVIFGPMIAIFSEALLLEFSVRLLGRNMAGFIVGSALAMSWNLFHKIFNFIIFYGNNIIEVYTNLMKFAEKQLRLQFNAVWAPIFVLLGLYIVFGVVTAIIGIRTGKAIKSGKTTYSDSIRFQEINTPGTGKQNKFSYSLGWLFANITLLIGLLLFAGRINFGIWALFVLVTATIWAFRYKRAYRQIIRPRFWIFFILITMLTAVVFTQLETEPVPVSEAILMGIEMNLRAILVIMGFTAIGTELYHPGIRKFFGNGYFKQLPLAIEISVDTLPAVIANTPDVKTILRNPVLVVSHLINYAEFRLDELKKNRLNEQKIYIITGGIGSGKTTLLKNLVPRFTTENIPVAGILSLRKMQGNTTTGYNIFDVKTGEEMVFLSTSGIDGQDKVGKYFISKNALEKGNAVLFTCKSGIVIIDETGLLELNDKGWAPSINHLLANKSCHLIFSVRQEVLAEIIQKFNISPVRIFNIQETETEDITKEILNTFRQVEGF
ncbi:MAG: nucleoside-triphosphatase [Draconibacterium sp.]